MLSGLILIAAVVLLGRSLGLWGIVPLAVTIGVLAGLVQMLGLLRWVYLVPSLARAYADPSVEAGQREASLPSSEPCTSTLESASVSISATSSPALVRHDRCRHRRTRRGADLVGVARGRRRRGLILGSAEFLGPNEENGWKLAGAAIPILYIVWSLWLLAMGIALVA